MSKKINQVEPNISELDVKNVTDYLSSGAWITEHKLTKSLEDSIAAYVNRKFAVAVPNGTIGIYLALLAAGLTDGKKVAVPNLTMIATINAILWANAVPIIVDTNDHLTMSLDSLKNAGELDGVIFVPLNGRTNSGEKIEEYCKEKNIKLIEDSAHALGSSYLNRNCGSLGDLSIFSFTPHKIITMGQGGLVLTDNELLYEYLLIIKTFNRSKDKSDWHDGFGLNFKITDLQAALGVSQFSRIGEFINKKNNIYKLYKDQLENVNIINFNNYETPWFIDIILDSKETRDNLNKHLFSQNIETRDSYPALSKQPYLKDVEKVNLESSESIAEKILWLPSSTNLDGDEVKSISKIINKYLNKY